MAKLSPTKFLLLISEVHLNMLLLLSLFYRKTNPANPVSNRLLEIIMVRSNVIKEAQGMGETLEGK